MSDTLTVDLAKLRRALERVLAPGLVVSVIEEARVDTAGPAAAAPSPDLVARHRLRLQGKRKLAGRGDG